MPCRTRSEYIRLLKRIIISHCSNCLNASNGDYDVDNYQSHKLVNRLKAFCEDENIAWTTPRLLLEFVNKNIKENPYEECNG